MTTTSLDPPGVFMGPHALLQVAAVLQDSRALRNQPRTIADELATVGKIEVLPGGGILCKQDVCDDDVFFVLTGAVNILVNGQIVAQRGPSEIIGEMALLEPSPKRSATVAARETTCVLRLSKEHFERVTDAHPQVWRGIAREIADRLRQRSRFVPAANEQPRMFLGSSVERLLVLDALLRGMSHDVVLESWTASFRPSTYTVDELAARLVNCDFAAFVFAPDDVTTSRGAAAPAVRDNVLFEAGLFIGVLGRERVFLVRPRNQDLRLPSDMAGLKPVDYTIDDGEPNVAAACADIRAMVRQLGCRQIRQVATNP